MSAAQQSYPAGLTSSPPLHTCGQKQRWCPQCDEAICDAPGHAAHVCSTPERVPCTARNAQGVPCRFDAGHEGQHRPVLR